MVQSAAKGAEKGLGVEVVTSKVRLTGNPAQGRGICHPNHREVIHFGGVRSRPDSGKVRSHTAISHVRRTLGHRDSLRFEIFTKIVCAGVRSKPVAELLGPGLPVNGE